MTMTTTLLNTLPTPNNLTLDLTSTVDVVVSNPSYPQIAFVVQTDLAKVEKAVANAVAYPYEVLRVETDKVSDYSRPLTDMDVPDSTQATYGLRVYTYNPTTEAVRIEFHRLLGVLGYGQVGEARYHQLHDETQATIDLVLAQQPSLRLKLETLVYDATARVMTNSTNPTRLEEIRTAVINRLVANTTRNLRTKAVDSVTKGTTVKVVRGRKIPLGTTGQVIWKGQNQWGWRVGIKVDPTKEEVLWTALGNVEAIYDDARVVAEAIAEAKAEYNKGDLAKLFGAARA